MNQITAIIFDVDGTLLDTHEFIYQAFEHAIRTHQMTPVDRDYIKSVSGDKLDQIYQALYPNFDFVKLADSHREFQHNHIHLATPFPFVLETLQNLKETDIKMAVVTGRAAPSSTRSLELAGISDFFDIVISENDVRKVKPDPEGLHKAMAYLNKSPDQTLMVGDMEADISAGKQANVKTVGVTYGFMGERINNYLPDYTVNSFSEITNLLGKD